MKKFCLLLFPYFFLLYVNAQVEETPANSNSENFINVPLGVLDPNQEIELPRSALYTLSNKLNYLVGGHNFNKSSSSMRFLVYPQISIVEKEIGSVNPTTYI